MPFETSIPDSFYKTHPRERGEPDFAYRQRLWKLWIESQGPATPAFKEPSDDPSGTP